jgi:hypothetical protein
VSFEPENNLSGSADIPAGMDNILMAIKERLE